MDNILHFANVALLDASDLSVDATSEAENVNNVTCIAIQSIWTGFGGAVTCYTEASNDGVNFTTVDSYSLSGVSGTRMLNIEKAGYAWIRARYEQVGGSGSLSVILNSKAI